MKIVLFGSHAALAWVHTFLLGAAFEAEVGPEILAIRETPTPELLSSLLAAPVEVFILADHRSALGLSSGDALLPADSVREAANRAVFALELARHSSRTLELKAEDSDLWAAMLATVAPTPRAETNVEPYHGTPETSMVDTLLSPYLVALYNAIEKSELLCVTWPRESFLDGDAPGAMLPATVEVAGRSRILAYGPYLPLPTGKWRVVVLLGFSADIGRLPFMIEVDTGASIERGFFEVNAGGIFTLAMEFRVTEVMHPIEMRLISQDSALEGQVALIEAKFFDCSQASG
jgi:hypothetical protein